MIPVKEAIKLGSWLNFISNIDLDDELIEFRMKILSFKKIDLSKVDEPNKISTEYASGTWWIMGVEFMSLSKIEILASYFIERILLVDKDGFKFNVDQDSHLCCSSKFAETSTLNRLFGVYIKPKLKIISALSFILPDDDETEYSLDIDGTVEEA